jgi:AcrR family transcriptional regulator
MQQEQIDAMVAAAAELFQRQGFEGTTVNQILQAVELSKGGLYHRIESKAELLFLALRNACYLMRQEIMESVVGITDPVEQLRALTRNHLTLILNHRGFLATPSADAGALDAKRRAEIIRLERRYLDFVRDVFERVALTRGVEVDPTIAAFNHLGMLLHVPRWYRTRGRLSPDEIADRITDTSLAALAPSRDRGPAVTGTA